MKEKCSIEIIKQQLDQAIDAGDVSAADELTGLLLSQQGLPLKTAMPEAFPQELCCGSRRKKSLHPRGHRKK